MYNPALSCYTQ